MLTIPNEAIRIHPEDAHNLSIITGIEERVFEANPDWIVYRHELNAYKWLVAPERRFRDWFPDMPIQDSRIPSA